MQQFFNAIWHYENDVVKKMLGRRNVERFVWDRRRHRKEPWFDRHAIHLACQRGNLEALKLVSNVVNVNVRDGQGNTPLHVACMFRNVECVVWLCTKAGADVNARNASGLIPGWYYFMNDEESTLEDVALKSLLLG